MNFRVGGIKLKRLFQVGGGFPKYVPVTVGYSQLVVNLSQFQVGLMKGGIAFQGLAVAVDAPIRAARRIQGLGSPEAGYLQVGLPIQALPPGVGEKTENQVAHYKGGGKIDHTPYPG